MKIKIIAICLIGGASLAISHSSSAQIRLGATSAMHLSSAASVNTPSVSNALRASTATAHQTEAKAVSSSRQIEGKTTATINRAKDNTRTDASVQTSSSVSVQKQ